MGKVKVPDSVLKQLNISAVSQLEEGESLELEGLEDQETPEELAILPLRGLVVYPMTAVPIRVGQPRSIKLIDDAVVEKRVIGLVASQDPDLVEPGPEDVYRVGVVAMVHRLFKAPDETITLIVQGLRRIRIDEFVGTEPYLTARVTEIPETVQETVEVEALQRSVVETFRRLTDLLPAVPEELMLMALNVDNPLQLAYAIATHVRIGLQEAQQLLELNGTREKLHLLLALLTKELEVVELGHKIQSEAQSEVEKAQRDYFLREQLKAIQRELGEASEQQLEVEEFRRKIEEANMPEEAETEAQRELDRLSKLPTAAAEYGVIRTYLDWLVNLPWDEETKDNLNIEHARKVLDEDHYDLEELKERILEYLAVRKLKEERKEERQEEELVDRIRREREGVILCFVGPPGRPGAGPGVHSPVAGRCARRGGDPRPSPHLHRRAARTHHPGAAPCRDEEPGLHAGRGGQDRRRLPWRSICRAAGGVGSGAEPGIP